MVCYHVKDNWKCGGEYQAGIRRTEWQWGKTEESRTVMVPMHQSNTTGYIFACWWRYWIRGLTFMEAGRSITTIITVWSGNITGSNVLSVNGRTGSFSFTSATLHGQKQAGERPGTKMSALKDKINDNIIYKIPISPWFLIKYHLISLAYI